MSDNNKKLSNKEVARISHSAGVEAAKRGAAIGGGISLIRNVSELVKNEKNAKEAFVDLVTGTGKSAAIGYGSAFLGSALKGAMQNAPAKLIRTLSKTNLPGIVVKSMVETGKTLSKYLGGEIDGAECLEELGEKGTGMLSSAAFTAQGALVGTWLIPIPGVGSVVGGVIGGMVGYTFASEYYKQIMKVLNGAKLAHEERLRIEAECEEAIQAIRAYRNELERLINNYLADYKETFNIALNEMTEAFESGDANGFIAGANSITRTLVGEPQFETVEEFRTLLIQGATFKLPTS